MGIVTANNKDRVSSGKVKVGFSYKKKLVKVLSDKLALTFPILTIPRMQVRKHVQTGMHVRKGGTCIRGETRREATALADYRQLL